MTDTTRDTILTTARALFLSLGYHKTSMRAVAQAAGISTGPLYFHFANKGELFFHICAQAHHRLLAAFQAAVAGHDRAGLKLRAVFLAYWDFFRAEPELFQILHLAENPLAGIDLPGDLQQKLLHLHHQIITLMAEIIRGGIAAGELRPFDPATLAIFLHSVAEGVFQAHRGGLLGSDQSGLDAIIATAVGVLGQGMLLTPESDPRRT